ITAGDVAALKLATADSAFLAVRSAELVTDLICLVTLISITTKIVDSSKNKAKNTDRMITSICAHSMRYTFLLMTLGQLSLTFSITQYWYGYNLVEVSLD